VAQKATCTRNILALHGHSGVDDAHPAVNLIRIVKLVADVNDGTEIISNIKHNDASEAVVETKASGRQTLGHSAVHARAGLVQARGQVLELSSAHISVVPDQNVETKDGFFNKRDYKNL
jgi:hypothetical protein